MTAPVTTLAWLLDPDATRIQAALTRSKTPDDLLLCRRGRRVVEHPTASNPPTRSRREGAVVDSIPLPESWKPVPGYEGLYEVSDLGRVRSLGRITIDVIGRQRAYPPKLMTLTTSGTPAYPTVRLTKKGMKSRNVRVHTLVAEAFIGPRPPGEEVRHLDDNGFNNTLPNIAYGSSSQNSQDMLRNGGHRGARQTHCVHGHEFSPDNTYWAAGGKHRLCKICCRVRQRESRRRVAARRRAAK